MLKHWYCVWVFIPPRVVFNKVVGDVDDDQDETQMENVDVVNTLMEGTIQNKLDGLQENTHRCLLLDFLTEIIPTTKSLDCFTIHAVYAKEFKIIFEVITYR